MKARWRCDEWMADWRTAGRRLLLLLLFFCFSSLQLHQGGGVTRVALWFHHLHDQAASSSALSARLHPPPVNCTSAFPSADRAHLFPTPPSLDLCRRVWAAVDWIGDTSGEEGRAEPELLVVVVDQRYAELLLNSLLSLILSRCLTRHHLHSAAECWAFGRAHPQRTAELLSGYLLIALDEPCQRYLQARGLPAVAIDDFPAPPFDVWPSAGAELRSVKDAWIYRWWLLWCLLSMGISVFHSDADVVYRSDPYQYFTRHSTVQGHPVDVHAGSGVYPELVYRRLGFTPQGGFIHIRSTDASLRYVESVVQRGFASDSKDDQVAASEVLMQWYEREVLALNASSTDGALPFHLECTPTSPMGRCFNVLLPPSPSTPSPASPSSPLDALPLLALHVVDTHSFLTGGVSRYAECAALPRHHQPDAVVVHPTAVPKQRDSKRQWLEREGYWLLNISLGGTNADRLTVADDVVTDRWHYWGLISNLTRTLPPVLFARVELPAISD